jgi:hypothetical protein
MLAPPSQRPVHWLPMGLKKGDIIDELKLY